jgi:hypothetical protein
MTATRLSVIGSVMAAAAVSVFGAARFAVVRADPPPGPFFFGHSGVPPAGGISGLDSRSSAPVFQGPAGADLQLGGNNEPTVAVDPNNPANVAEASLFQLRVSTDGGTSFQPAVAAVVPGTHGLCGDPSLAFDSQGRLFWTYLGCVGNTGPMDIFIARVNPATGAILAGYPVNVTASPGVNLPAGPGSNHDKEWLAADSFGTSPFADRLYVVWTEFIPAGTRVLTTSSTNQGMTWTAPVQLSGERARASYGRATTRWRRTETSMPPTIPKAVSMRMGRPTGSPGRSSSAVR